MADKRKKELFNPLAGFEDEDEEPAPKPAPKPNAAPAPRRRKELDNPLSLLAPADVRRAVHPEGKDTTMAGRYRRRSILIEPEMDDAISQQSETLGVGKMELVRYLLAVGLAELSHGDRVPTRQKVVALKLEMPEWKG